MSVQRRLGRGFMGAAQALGARRPSSQGQQNDLPLGDNDAENDEFLRKLIAQFGSQFGVESPNELPESLRKMFRKF